MALKSFLFFDAYITHWKNPPLHLNFDAKEMNDKPVREVLGTGSWKYYKFILAHAS
jgi:hypothetical protein